MRWLFGLVSMVVALALAAPILQRLQQQAQNSPLARKSAETTPSAAPAESRGNERATTGSKSVKLYRWVDADGTIHYEMSPPPEGGAEELTMRVDSPEPSANGGSSGESGTKPSGGSLPSNPFSVYTPQGQEELMERLDQTLEKLGERQQLMKDLKGDL